MLQLKGQIQQDSCFGISATPEQRIEKFCRGDKLAHADFMLGREGIVQRNAAPLEGVLLVGAGGVCHVLHADRFDGMQGGRCFFHKLARQCHFWRLPRFHPAPR